MAIMREYGVRGRRVNRNRYTETIHMGRLVTVAIVFVLTATPGARVLCEVTCAPHTAAAEPDCHSPSPDADFTLGGLELCTPVIAVESVIIPRVQDVLAVPAAEWTSSAAESGSATTGRPHGPSAAPGNSPPLGFLRPLRL